MGMGKKRKRAYRPPAVVSLPVDEVERLLAEHYRRAAEKWSGGGGRG